MIFHQKTDPAKHLRKLTMTRMNLGCVILVLVALFGSTDWTLFVSDAEARCRGCGCRGGPGVRGSNGRCLGWAEMGRSGTSYRPNSSALRSYSNSSPNLSAAPATAALIPTPKPTVSESAPQTQPKGANTFGLIQNPGKFSDTSPETSIPKSSSVARELTSLTGRMEVQRQLIKLGYLTEEADGVWGPASRHALRSFRTRHGLGADELWDAPTEQKLFSDERPLPNVPYRTAKPQEVNVAYYAPPHGAARNPLNRNDAEWIQNRLRALGYYRPEGKSDGLWGIASHEALVEFQSANDLHATGTWDVSTERKLQDPNANRSRDFFSGVWAPHTEQCGRGLNTFSNITITKDSIEELGTACTFDTVTITAPENWKVVALCKRGLFMQSQTDIELKVVGDRLLVRRNGYSRTYSRCL